MKKGIATLAVLGLTFCGPSTKEPKWESRHIEAECARYLDIEWTIEDGATEGLTAFNLCITNPDYRAELAYKYQGR